MKTSISLPAADEQHWRVHRKKIFARLPSYLRRFHQQKVRRIGLKQFSNCEMGLVRFNVYWDQESYNQLHAVAHALCMSVSHLLWQILQFVVAGGEVSESFSNYAFKAGTWSSRAMSFSEKLVFHTPPPRKHRHKTPNIWDKPPLRFTA
ncbi:hypothetical protein [Turneriella parva]|nr:hypothetical protein [Turneriella parva]